MHISSDPDLPARTWIRVHDEVFMLISFPPGGQVVLLLGEINLTPT
jgi:hypothetical protein